MTARPRPAELLCRSATRRGLLAGAGAALVSGRRTMAAEPGWRTAQPIPLGRSEVGAASISTFLFVAGGFGGVARMDRYDSTVGQWTVCADLPVGVHHPAMTAVGNALYLAGGFTEPDHAATAVFARYDLNEDRWTRLADLSAPRGAGGLVALDDALYYVGGTLEALGGPAISWAERYDVAADRWEPVASLPAAREHLAVVAHGGGIHVIGGRADGSEADEIAGAHTRYDPVADRWETLTPLPAPRGGLAGVVVADRVIVLGGERGDAVFADVNAYDPATATWSNLPAMPTARHGLGAAVIGTTIHAIAGSIDPGGVENTDVHEVHDAG